MSFSKTSVKGNVMQPERVPFDIVYGSYALNSLQGWQLRNGTQDVACGFTRIPQDWRVNRPSAIRLKWYMGSPAVNRTYALSVGINLTRPAPNAVVFSITNIYNAVAYVIACAGGGDLAIIDTPILANVLIAGETLHFGVYGNQASNNWLQSAELVSPNSGEGNT